MGIVCFLGDYSMYIASWRASTFGATALVTKQRGHQNRTSKDAAFDGASFPIIIMCFCAVLAGHIVEHKKQSPNDLITPSLDQIHMPKYASAVYLRYHYYTPDLLVAAMLKTTLGSLDAVAGSACLITSSQYPPAAQRNAGWTDIPFLVPT